MTKLVIDVTEIQTGDRLLEPDGTLSWIALADAEESEPTVFPAWFNRPSEMTVTVAVEYADGGRGVRAWTHIAGQPFPLFRLSDADYNLGREGLPRSGRDLTLQQP